MCWIDYKILKQQTQNVKSFSAVQIYCTKVTSSHRKIVGNV